MWRLMRVSALLLTAAIGPGCRPAPPAAASLRGRESQRALNRSLIEAAYRGDEAAVRRQLAAGAWGDAPYGAGGNDDWDDGPPGARKFGKNRWRALHAVAESEGTFDRVAVARVLVEAGCSVNVDDGYGATPLYTALSNGHDALAMFLIDAGANVNTSTQTYIDEWQGTPLEVAVRRDRPLIVKALLDHGARMEAGDGLLCHAAGHGSVESAKVLLAAGADVNEKRDGADQTTPLLLATSGLPNLEMVRLLLDAGADVRARRKWRFETVRADEAAVDRQDGDGNDVDDEERARRVREREEETKLRIETPLLNALEERWNESKFVPPSSEIVKLLVVAGADVNEANEDGSTPLHLVAEQCWSAKDHTAELEIARLVIDAGAKLDAKDKAGKTPLELLEGESPNEAQKALAQMLREAAARANAQRG